jgi:hypothetical protein
MSERTTLSFKKFSALLAKHSYIITSVYADSSNQVHFIETRTPKLQRSFMIHVPPKYRMVLDSAAYKSLILTPTNVSPAQKQVDQLIEIKGNILSCDIVSITSKTVCVYLNNGKFVHYLMGNVSVSTQNEDSATEPAETDIGALIETATGILEKEDPGFSIPKLAEDKIGVDLPDTDDIIHPAAPTEPIELDFVVDPPPAPEVVLPEEVLPIEEIPRNTKTTSLNYRKDNAIPPFLEEAAVDSGLIQVCIDVPDFYKKVDPSQFEIEVITIYDVLDDNENEARIGKLEYIVKAAEDLAAKTKKDLETFATREAMLKESVLSLSAILERSEVVRAKRIAAGMGGAALQDLERVYTQTRSAIYDVNIELLKLKDHTNELLETTQECLEMLLSS